MKKFARASRVAIRNLALAAAPAVLLGVTPVAAQTATVKELRLGAFVKKIIEDTARAAGAGILVLSTSNFPDHHGPLLRLKGDEDGDGETPVIQ